MAQHNRISSHTQAYANRHVILIEYKQTTIDRVEELTNGAAALYSCANKTELHAALCTVKGNQWDMQITMYELDTQ